MKANSLSSLKKALGVLFIGMMMTQGTKAQDGRFTAPFLKPENHGIDFFVNGIRDNNLPLQYGLTVQEWCDSFISIFNEKSRENGWVKSDGSIVEIGKKDYVTVEHCIQLYCRTMTTGAKDAAWPPNTEEVAYLEIENGKRTMIFKERGNYASEVFVIFDPSTCPMIVNPTSYEAMFSDWCGQFVRKSENFSNRLNTQLSRGINNGNSNGGGNVTYNSTTNNYTTYNTSNPQSPAVQKDNTWKYYAASVISATLISGISYYLMRNTYNQTAYVPQSTIGSTTLQTIYVPQIIPNVNYNSQIPINPRFIGVGNNTIANVAPLSINQGSSAIGSNTNSNVNYGTSAGTNYSYNNGNSGQGYQNYNNGNSGQQPNFTFGNGAYHP